ncbi:MAG: tetratricopeptide repeat protein [Gammaproteobacteria bacterium]|nr:tetratricopeptide repeat protein [Gammaproteobacteria bacterium]NIV49699.1 tetratricopeptide repeat protein [Gammaproteobacteria bacterium]NIW57097.1 tetratricopeptide repeat protein [Gammaproteobacteria bacterium]
MTQQVYSAAGELSRAVRLHQAGDLEAANAIYGRILESNPDHPDALNLAGVIAHQTGDQESAIRLLERAVSINDANAGYYNNLGEAYRAFGQNHRAIDAFENALRINPGDVAANNNLGLALQSQQRYEEARSAYSRALELAPNDVEVWLNLGNLHREFCHLEESADAFRRAIAASPELAGGHAALGVTLYEAGDSQAAIASLLEAVSLDPLYIEAHENLKKIRWFEGEHERVDDSFRDACQRLPHSGRAFCNLGSALLASQDYINAEQALLKALQLDPALGDAFHALAQVYRNLERIEPALAAHERAVASAPRNALFREEFGTTLILARQFERAVAELRVGHDLHPRRSSILGFLTIALNELGDSSVRELVDYERFVRVARIDVPDGYDSLESFNAELHEELAQQHKIPYHPMDQTMRGGTQTPNNLFQSPTGLVRVLKEQITKVILAFIDDLEPDPKHPFLRFINRDFVFTGVWSTIIKENGFDRSHVHNEGWMSGTYYAKVPRFDQAQSTRHDGCIQFGEPNKRYASERNSTQRVIAPEVGTVVLFPSYYWHGVRAFDRNGVRHSVSYDLI